METLLHVSRASLRKETSLLESNEQHLDMLRAWDDAVGGLSVKNKNSSPAKITLCFIIDCNSLKVNAENQTPPTKFSRQDFVTGCPRAQH